MKKEDRLMAKVIAALYALSASIMLLLAVQNYRYGMFELVYSASLMMTLFAGLSIYARFSAGTKHLQKASIWGLWLCLGIITLDAFQHADEVKHWVYPLGLLAFITLPLRSANKLNLSALSAFSALLWWHYGHNQALIFASSYLLLIALASTYAQLHQKRNRTLVELAIRDPLTNAYNFRHLEDTLGKELCRADRTGRPLSLIALEVDYFPQILDVQGKHTANDLIKQLSETLATMIRAGDSQYCDSEDTFYLLLPCTPSEGVLVIAERIRRAIEQKNWPAVDSITASLGCTSYQSGTRDCTVNSFINDANIALVEAQKNGHNRVCHQG